MTLSKTYIKNKNAYKVSFQLAKEMVGEAKDVRLLGDFNDWNWEAAPALKAKKNNLEVNLELAAGKKYEYRYFVDQSHWLNDDAADAYVPSPFYDIYNCVVDLPTPAKPSPSKPRSSKPRTSKSRTVKVKFDFTKVEGIGSKISQLLIENGYSSFQNLATAKPAAIKKILSAAGSRYAMHDPATWPKQAKLLDAGKLAELKALQAKLKGGKKK